MWFFVRYFQRENISDIFFSSRAIIGCPSVGTPLNPVTVGSGEFPGISLGSIAGMRQLCCVS